MPSPLNICNNSRTKYPIMRIAEGIGIRKYRYMLESGYKTAKANITAYKAPDAPITEMFGPKK